jgi:hypothetical protein
MLLSHHVTWQKLDPARTNRKWPGRRLGRGLGLASQAARPGKAAARPGGARRAECTPGEILLEPLCMHANCMLTHTHEPGIKWVGRANSPRVQQVRSQSRIRVLPETESASRQYEHGRSGLLELQVLPTSQSHGPLYGELP